MTGMRMGAGIERRRGWQDPTGPYLLSIEDYNSVCTLWIMLSDLFAC